MKNLLCVLVLFCVCKLQGNGISNFDSYHRDNPVNEILFPRGKTAYILANPVTALEKRTVEYLANYLERVLLQPVKIVPRIKNVPSNSPLIIIKKDFEGAAGNEFSHPESFSINSQTLKGRKLITVEGKSDKGIKRAIQKLIIKSEQRPDGLYFGPLDISSSPWISKREWTLCPWAPDIVRRSFSNPNADKRNNIWLYGETQLAAYVDMFDWFGYSGVQLMETVANYGILGSPESFQDRQKILANAARSNGQDVTLWVWAAQFDDYGWKDPEVKYNSGNGEPSFNDPAVRATFERYYDLYSNLAPYADMLIAHYYDPGKLKRKDDVFNYMKLLYEKFRARNPGIKLGVDFWQAGSDSLFMDDLIKNGFNDALLLESGMPHLYQQGQRESLHKTAKNAGLKMGVWGWYTTEYETDQMPSMFVNAKLMKKFFNEVKHGAHSIHPISYWSEMDAYHLNNIFSMYAAGQLLWDPERDPDEIIGEIAEAIWGPINGKIVAKALHLIQDTRSGDNWDSYWWYREKSKAGMAPPESDLARANEILKEMEQLAIDKGFIPKIPLPFPPKVLLELMIPHLIQIRDFAQFRVNIAEIYKEVEKGTDKSTIEQMAAKAWIPIPELNTWVGNFGQPEAIMQENIMSKLRKDLGIVVNTPEWIIYRDADRYLQRILTLQRSSKDPVRFKPRSNSTLNGARTRSEFNWSEEKAVECVEHLYKAGLLKLVGEDTYQLNDHLLN